MAAPSPGHSRESSNENSQSSYSMILEHTLQYPSTYELPLQTMFALNSNPQPAAQRDAQAATAQFTSAMMNQISRLPSQPCSLPPSFITDFVRRCFTPELVEVDFPQSLTSLDYLRDLERRRQKERDKALQRLGLQSEQHPSRHAERFQRRDQKAGNWLRNFENAERKIEASYTQLYIVLRRWIIINELSLLPFNKHNCLAMLNTLYPPINNTAPTSYLTPQILRSQRDIFFKYIKSVEKNGTWVLEELMQHGKESEDENGWPAARRTLELYLRLANAFLHESYGIGHYDDAFAEDPSKPIARRKERKADSGVSFNSRPSSGRRSSATSDTNSSALPSPTFFNASTPLGAPQTQDPTPAKGLSKLERIAYELRRIRSRNKATDSDKENELVSNVPSQQQTSSPQTPLRKKSSVGGSLRKLRSLGDLKGSANRSASSASNRNEATPAFNKEEMKRQRILYEANATKSLPRPPNEV